MNYFYYQIGGGEEAWSEALAEHRQQLIATKHPRYTTVLELSTLISPGTSREDQAAIKYRGPFYIDWDGPNIETVLEKFQQFLVTLSGMEVDLASCRLFATGSKGFHAELPQELFLAKPPKAGIQSLPAIYKEMAFELYTDFMDLRVYTARKGRMWRTPNVKRENGAYKVPLTIEEAMTMKASDYPTLVSAPRAAPGLAEPVLNQRLAVVYAKAEQKVVAAAKRRKDSVKDLELLARFKGEYPPSLLRVMAGEQPTEGGFHKTAMQVAITSNALGKKEDEMLALCAGLVENHVSDGHRYNTVVKRQNELSRMFRYTQDNVCYLYNRDAVRALLPKSVPAPDLDGLPAAAGEITAKGENGNDDGLLGGVFITEAGIYRRTEDGVLKLSDLSFKDVTMLADAMTHKPLGFEAEVVVNNRGRGRQLVDLQTFLSKSHFSRFAMQHMAIVTGNDNQVAAVAAILRDTAMSNGGIVYVIAREGLDLIQRPETKEQVMDFVWVTPKHVETQSPVLYKHRGSPTIDGVFKSDLMDAPPLQGTPLAEKVIDALLNVNEPFVVANALGWMVGAFHKQIYHHIYNQFPLLMLYGQSGAGKTSTIDDFLALHYYLSKPVIHQADSSTRFAIEGAMSSSASIPCVLEEYKPREMRIGRHGMLKSLMRSAYNSQTYSKGAMAQDVGSTWRDLRSFAFAAPVCYIGEALETETAVCDRTIAVALKKGGLLGRTQHHYLLRDNRAVLASLGREIVRATFALDFERFRAHVDSNRALAEQLAFKRNNDRPVFNLAVIMTSLEFLAKVLNQHFGERFDKRIDELKHILTDGQQQLVVTVMPEAAKVLNALALISRTEEPMSEFGLQQARDYLVVEDNLELNMRNCYVKYAAWCRRKGQTSYYDNEDAFMHGLGNYAPMRSKSCVDSKLKVSGIERIFRFSVKDLAEEGVEPFKS